MDLSALSLSELRRLQTRIGTEIRKRNDVAKRELLKKMKKLAAEEGFSLTDVLGEKKKSATATAAPTQKRAARGAGRKRKLPHKYFHPENSNIGWSGRGRKPQWIIDWTAQGRALEELESQRS